MTTPSALTDSLDACRPCRFDVKRDTWYLLYSAYCLCKKKTPAHFRTLLLKLHTVSYRGLHSIMPVTQRFPQINELRVQPERQRKAVWAVLCARSTARQSGVRAVPESYSCCMATATAATVNSSLPPLHEKYMGFP